MSKSFKIKKKKTKEEKKAEKSLREPKHGAKFMKGSREKGTIGTNFSGKSSKEYSRKKT